MSRDARAYLWDLHQAAADVALFTKEKQFEDYRRDALLRAAMERKFEVIGEALLQLLRRFPDFRDRISHSEQIIAFRERLIHGYAAVSDELVWDVVVTYL